MMRSTWGKPSRYEVDHVSPRLRQADIWSSQSAGRMSHLRRREGHRCRKIVPVHPSLGLARTLALLSMPRSVYGRRESI